MRNVFRSLILFLTCLPALAAAQTASSICVEEASRAFSWVDIPTLKAGTELRVSGFKTQFYMKEGGEPRVSDGYLYAGKGFCQVNLGDQVSYENGNEAQLFVANQNTLYLVKPGSLRTTLLPGLDAGIFAHATVRDCRFFVAPDQKSLWKEAWMDLDEATAARTKIQKITIWIDPLDSSLKHVDVLYQHHHLYSRAVLDFAVIHGFGGTDLSSPFLKPEGTFKPGYENARLVDTR